jgi:hypothetical protein
METKVVNGFVWLVVTNKAKEVFSSGTFDLYVLHDDKSESLVETYAQINDAIEYGLDIAIEVGSLSEIVNQFNNQ